MTDGYAAVGTGVLLDVGGEDAAVGLQQREQRTVQLTELLIDAGQLCLLLR